MKNRMIGFIILVFVFSGCQKASSTLTQEREQKNLTAFAKVYGHVKYFHPSDESRKVSWDKLAILGVRKIQHAKNEEELKNVLEEVFLPLAPTVKFVESPPSGGEFLNAYLQEIQTDTSTLQTVAWQHIGVDMEQDNHVYESSRINRADNVYGRNFFLYKDFDASAVRGDSIRLQASIKTDIDEDDFGGELYLKVGDTFTLPIMNTNQRKGIKTENTWQDFSIGKRVGNMAENGMVGIKLNGAGSLWVDHVRLEVKDASGEWKPIAIQNSSFEEQRGGRPIHWYSSVTGGYHYSVVSDESVVGSNSFKMESRDSDFANSLFTEFPKVGEFAVQKISDRLWSIVPLALYSDQESTLPKGSKTDFNRLNSELDTIHLSSLTADDKELRLANVIITWNIFQHFYPYFDVVRADWDLQLQESLARSRKDQNTEDFYKTLSTMLASLQDGHISLYHPSKSSGSGLPFLVDMVDDQIVVSHSLYKEIQPGDIILSLNGRNAVDVVRSQKELLSGSDQWTLMKALREFGSGERNEEANVTVQDAESVKAYSVKRSSLHSVAKIEKNHLPVLGEIEKGVFYVDLDRAPMEEINDKIDKIAGSEGVIFDLRGYPNRNHQIISHLLTEPDTSGQWMQVPKIIYPDQKNIAGYTKHGWFMQPAEPHIQGKVVFITDGRAISYAESFMGLIEHYDLGEIVGQPTAGTNGNVNSVELPGGFRFGWTGMKVQKHDGSQHHLVGIQPTSHVYKTVEGLRNREDEFLNRALEIVKTN